MPRKRKKRKASGPLDFIENVLDGALQAARIYEKSAKLKRSIHKASHSDVAQKKSGSEIKDPSDEQKDEEKIDQWTPEGWLKPRVRL